MLDEGMYKKSIQNMHNICWKAQYFKSDDVSMLGHVYGVSQYPQFYEKIKKKYQNATTSTCEKIIKGKGSPIFAMKMDYLIGKKS